MPSVRCRKILRQAKSPTSMKEILHTKISTAISDQGSPASPLMFLLVIARALVDE
jgi:hypothetical protein